MSDFLQDIKDMVQDFIDAMRLDPVEWWDKVFDWFTGGPSPFPEDRDDD